jgi:hypothetical protein
MWLHFDVESYETIDELYSEWTRRGARVIERPQDRPWDIMPVAKALREWRRLLKPTGLIAFSAMRECSPPAAHIFRQCAAQFGLSLSDPSEELGTALRCQAALISAGFEVVEVLVEQVAFSAQDLALAWESNSRTAGHSEVQSLSLEDQAALRMQYLDALVRVQHETPGTLERADVLYAVGRRW